jgi:hypothetical protein
VITVRLTSAPGGFEAGSGFGIGLVRGVLFSLFLLSVLSTVPGTGRLSPELAQLHKVSAVPTTHIGK